MHKELNLLMLLKVLVSKIDLFFKVVIIYQNKSKKMAVNDKLSVCWLKDFKELDVPDLIFNIWSYNTNKGHLNECGICNLGSKYAIMALREKWEDDWGDFKYIVNKWKANDKNYMDVGKYSNENKHEMINFIKKYNKKNL